MNRDSIMKSDATDAIKVEGTIDALCEFLGSIFGIAGYTESGLRRKVSYDF